MRLLVLHHSHPAQYEWIAFCIRPICQIAIHFPQTSTSWNTNPMRELILFNTASQPLSSMYSRSVDEHRHLLENSLCCRLGLWGSTKKLQMLKFVWVCGPHLWAPYVLIWIENPLKSGDLWQSSLFRKYNFRVEVRITFKAGWILMDFGVQG